MNIEYYKWWSPGLNISVRVEYWEHDVNHDWPWWHKMMNHVLYSF